MAKELKHRSWDDYGRIRLPAEVRYPWHKWLNGSMWFLIEGEDFDDIRNFQKYAHAYARNWGMRIKTKQNEAKTGLFIKAYKATTKDGAQRRRHFRAVERKYLAAQHGDDPADYEPSPHLRDDNYEPKDPD